MTIWMPVEPEANELLTRSPLALLIAMLLDQQVTLEKAFSAPLDLVRRLGHEPTAAELADFDPDRLAAIFSERPALHRYPKAMAARVKELGVKPELEVFDTGQLVLVHELIAEGLIESPALIQLCMGIPYGAPDDPQTLLALVARLPADCHFSAFSIGRMQLPFVALAPLVGANVRVGLEDNLYLARGRLATNRELVQRAVTILESINVGVLGPDAVRERLGLRRHG